MTECEVTPIPIEIIEDYDLVSELKTREILEFVVNDKQASRLKKDWDKYGAYKLAYACGHTRKGLWLSFV